MIEFLVVDDNEHNLQLLQFLLEEYGYRFTGARDGAEALEKARHRPPDVIVSDVLMPVMDGFVFCRECKRDEKLKHIPFIFLTATYTDPEDEELGRNLGAEHFLLKTMPPAELLKTLQSVVKEHDQQQEIEPTEHQEEAASLRKYNQALIRKLEDKITELGEVNRALEMENGERWRAELALQKANAALEKRVAERTAELQVANTLLAQRATELTRSNDELKQFAYVASHDLQEPLRMVSSFLTLLQQRYQGQLDEEADEFIGFAVDGATRMSRLIKDLLSYSRVGTHGKEFASTDTQAILDQVLFNLRLAIEESGVSVTQDPMPTVLGDDGQLVQLLQNLIANALKFRGDTAPEIHIGAEQQDGTWLFSVRDNGIGIEPQYAERIFGMFQRLHGTDDYEGTGIGLAVCRKIVERHGGQIWVESELGQGATFFFTIPVETEEVPIES